MPIDTKPRPLGPGDHAVAVMADIARANRAIGPKALLYIDNEDAESNLAIAQGHLHKAFEALRATAIEHGAAGIDLEGLKSWGICDAQ